jgi:hypothetical protein
MSAPSSYGQALALAASLASRASSVQATITSDGARYHDHTIVITANLLSMKG